MDKIIMKEMSFYGYHGVLQQERDLGQTFVVDVELGLDLRVAGESDDPEMTVSYADVYEVVRRVVTGRPCNLIEAVAERIADRLLDGFLLREVLVRVKKPGAPVPGHFGYMGVEIKRSRETMEEN
ncbi:dihydroneopterin aldolase [Desulfotruncus arcticus]|nr:dihydroneopterin aldolase [Desulfotruncus arcticus]